MELSSELKWKKNLEITRLLQTNNPSLIESWILENPDYLNAPDSKKNLLNTCILINKPKSLEKVLELNLILIDKTKSNLVIRACQYGSTKSLVTLLKLGFNPLHEESNVSPLSEACRVGSYGCAKTLLKVGVKPNTTTHRELLLASTMQKHEVLRLILDTYPENIIESIASEELHPAIDSKEPYIVSKTYNDKILADNLTRKIAKEITKSLSRSKVKDILNKTPNILDI